jgi:hypothetical protein
MIVAVVLDGATLAFSYFAIVSADSPGCAGRNTFPSHILPDSDRETFFVIPLIAVFGLVPFMRGRREESIAKAVADYDMPVLLFGPIRLTFGMLVIYLSLGGFVAFIGFTTAVSVDGYEVISSYCGSAIAPGRG